MSERSFDQLVREDDQPRLEVGYCRACERNVFPASEHCPSCLEAQIEPRFVSQGELETFTAVHTPKAGFPSPYTIGFVRVTDDVRVFTYLTDDVDAYEIGMTVHVQAASFGEFEETWAFGRSEAHA